MQLSLYNLDPHALRNSDERPNTGLREGDIPHQEVNTALRTYPKTVIFGQQTRLRNGVLLPDEKLSRFHAGHDIVKFFYGAVRQLPPYLVDGLLDMNVSVTLVGGPQLLVFHHPRAHQSFHIGRTRRTIYMPEAVLREAYNKGYDYWAISEVLIQEGWALLDYLLIYEFVRRCQDRLQRRYTLSYSFIRDTLHNLNKHRHDSEEDDEDEFDMFFRYYAEHFFALDRQIVQRDPFDATDEIYDESRERFWAALKLHDIGRVYRFPTYFALDRDIVHGAAFRIASELSMPLEPQTTDEIMHDLWDEARFKLSRSLKTEELLERLIAMGAEGIQAFLETVAEEQVFGYQFVTANRYDGHDVFAAFKKMLQNYSSTLHAEVPGCLGFEFNNLYQHYLHNKRFELFERFKTMTRQAQDEHVFQVREMLFRVVEVRLHPQRAPDFKRAIEFAASARQLIETGEQLLEPVEAHLAVEHICGLLARLDRHPLYHTEYLDQYRALSGNEHIVLKENIQPEIERLYAHVPERPYNFSSDPQGVRARHHQFQQMRRNDPDAQQLLALLAALLVRFDRAENYDELVEQVRGLGVYAHPALEEIAAEERPTDEDGRGEIRATADLLLREV